MMYILTDRGPGFIGNEWSVFMENWGVTMITVPRDAAFSNGITERQIDLIKISFAKAEEMYPGESEWSIMQKVTTAKNMSPNLNTGLAPITCMIGRSDLFGSLESTPQILSEDVTDAQGGKLFAAQENLRKLFDLRIFMMKKDAARAIKLCDSRYVRAGGVNIPNIGDAVMIYIPSIKRWQTGFRMIGKFHSCAILEKGRSMRKHPLCWTRRLNAPEMVTVPNDNEEDSNVENDPTNAQPSERTIMYASTVSPRMNDLSLRWEQVQQFCYQALGEETEEERDNDIGKIDIDKEGSAPEMTLEEENDLISHTNPSRIAPRIFLAIPNARKAIEDEITNLLKPDQNGIPSLKCQPLGLAENKYRAVVASTMVVKRKSTNTFKARLCVRGDLLAPDIPLDFASPTVSRASPRLILTISTILKMTLGIIDISSAFTQSELVAPEHRILITMPWYVPLPFLGKIDTSRDRHATATHALLTLRPLYGTTDAPIRWFSSISMQFKKCGWMQLQGDPCVFRLSSDTTLHALAAIHVDDILVSATSLGWESFKKVVDGYRHSGIKMIDETEALMYLGLDIGKENGKIFLSQESYISGKLYATDEKSLYTPKGEMIPEGKRKTECKKLIGSLLWAIQTRPEQCHKISALASDIVTAVKDEAEFLKWIRRGNKLVSILKGEQYRIYFQSPIPWIPDSVAELANCIQIFAFCDASYGSMRDNGSIESAFIIVGRVKFRNGDLSCQGCYIDSCARKIHRVCRSSLGAEAVALANSADLSIWIRVLLLEMIMGQFCKELVDPSTQFKLLIPFGAAPTNEDVFNELFGKEKTPAQVFDLRGESKQKEMLEKAMRKLEENPDYMQSWCRLLLMTDSYNCYSSILSGSPKNSEKSINIQLAYVRDISESLALTFIDKNFNLADCSTKTHGDNNKILRTFLKYGCFKIGFLGRVKVKEMLSKISHDKKNGSATESIGHQR